MQRLINLHLTEKNHHAFNKLFRHIQPAGTTTIKALNSLLFGGIRFIINPGDIFIIIYEFL